jgi:hypothetical protein
MSLCGSCAKSHIQVSIVAVLQTRSLPYRLRLVMPLYGQLHGRFIFGAMYESAQLFVPV